MSNPGESPNALLEMARLIVEEGGAEALSMKALMEQSGMSRATLYRRVGSLREILKKLGAENDSITRRVLDASRVVFTQQGFEGTTLEDIALEAGVGIATIYRRFGTREGLINAFVEDIRPGAALSGLHLSPDDGLESNLTKVAQQLLEHLSIHRDVVLLILSEGRRPGSPLLSVASPPGQSLKRISSYFQLMMDTGHLKPGDPNSLALAFIMPLLGEALVKPLIFQGPDGRSEALAKHHIDRFLRGALAPGRQQ